MATYYLINAVVFANATLTPGELLDDTVTDTAAVQDAGGLLWPSADANVAAAALVAQSARINRGADTATMQAIMQAAVDKSQGTGGLSSVTPLAIGTAAAGTSTAASRGDHVHAHGNQAAGNLFHAAATGSVAGFLSAADKTRLDTMQAGTGVLVAGVSAAIAATITASSRIIATPKDKGASVTIGRLEIPAADRVVGAPGSFKVRAFKADATAETADVSTFDWHVEN